MLFKHTLKSIEVCICILNSLVYYVLFNGVNLFALLQIKMEISSSFSTNHYFYKWALS